MQFREAINALARRIRALEELGGLSEQEREALGVVEAFLTGCEFQSSQQAMQPSAPGRVQRHPTCDNCGIESLLYECPSCSRWYCEQCNRTHYRYCEENQGPIAMCRGRYENGLRKKYAVCDSCGHVSYEANEGDKCVRED